MKPLLVLLALVAALPVHAGPSSRSNGQTVQSELPKPTLVQSVDTDKHTISFGREGAEPETYSYDNFTRIMVNGKPGKIEDVQVGMRIGVTGSTSTKKASRIDADTYVPPKNATTKKK
jgi:hypothetical protein